MFDTGRRSVYTVGMQIGVRLPDELVAMVDEYADANYLDRSAVIRQILWRYFEDPPSREKK